jgi:hypothetical protein
MASQVQLLYHDPSLGRQVNFVLKRLEILHVDPPSLQRPHDIDRFLSSFCTWQRGENPPGDSDPLHWDHALILTGLDLYVVSKNGKVSSQVVGMYRYYCSYKECTLNVFALLRMERSDETSILHAICTDMVAHV